MATLTHTHAHEHTHTQNPKRKQKHIHTCTQSREHKGGRGGGGGRNDRKNNTEKDKTKRKQEENMCCHDTKQLSAEGRTSTPSAPDCTLPLRTPRVGGDANIEPALFDRSRPTRSPPPPSTALLPAVSRKSPEVELAGVIAIRCLSCRNNKNEEACK